MFGSLLILPACSSYTVRCRKVSAAEFMRPHTFKGIPSDAFIGVTDQKAFKKIFRFGFVDSWEVLWTPAKDLPSDYIKQAPNKERGFPHGRRLQSGDVLYTAPKPQ